MKIPVMIKVGLGFFALMVVCSCVTRDEFRYLNDQIVALNKRVDGLEAETQKELSDTLNAELGAVREQQADNMAEIKEIRTELQDINGQVQENNHWIKRSVERDTTKEDALQARIAELEAKLTALDARTDRLYAHLGLKIQSQEQGAAAPKGPQAAQGSKPASPEAPKPDDVSAEKRLYDVNLALFKNEQYEEALSGFKNFLNKYPKSGFADNAQFWIGECHMGLKQFEQAILAYQNVIKHYPKGNKVPNALLRQARAFYEINDETSAKLLLKKIISKYPKSREAGIAKKRLAKMK